MNVTKSQNVKKKLFQLSLRKNRFKAADETKKLNRSSDVIILDESLEKLRSDFPKRLLHSSPKMFSPIVITDSDENSGETDEESIQVVVIEESLEINKSYNEMHNDTGNEPSRGGNISFNCSKDMSIFDTKSRPSMGGWSPAQGILTATPKHTPVPATPKDIFNKSSEQCSIKKIQDSQTKLLNDLYGEEWKSIPKLFKTIYRNHKNYDSVSKKLFNEESDKENIKSHIRSTKKLLAEQNETGKLAFDGREKCDNQSNILEKKSKKKLYTEKIPNTPDITKTKPKVTRNVNTTSKKTKGMSVTELVGLLDKDVETLRKKIETVKVAPQTPVTPVQEVKRLSFMASLGDNIPSWRCHIEALQYRDNFIQLRDQLTRRLFTEFNKCIFNEELDADMLITWDSKLRSTAGITTNRLIKTSSGTQIRTSAIRLSTKVADCPRRLRDTLVHELCHAATWLLDHCLRAGHGPLWRKWAAKSLRVFPELGEISRCHDLDIHHKYQYRCTKCGYSMLLPWKTPIWNIKRHSKSIDVTKKCCGYCRGTFEIIVNKKKKDGVIVSTPARKGGPNEFALYVKENYANTKDKKKTHAQVMKLLGEQFSAKKNKLKDLEES